MMYLRFLDSLPTSLNEYIERYVTFSCKGDGVEKLIGFNSNEKIAYLSIKYSDGTAIVYVQSLTKRMCKYCGVNNDPQEDLHLMLFDIYCNKHLGDGYGE